MRLSLMFRVVFPCALAFNAMMAIADSQPPSSIDYSHLTLDACFDAARSNNVSVRIALAALREIEGESIIVRSRFLPHLYGTVKAGSLGITDSINNLHQSTGSSVAITLSQRLAEFGPTANEEYARISNKRQKLYAYENQILEVLSEVRLAYFLLRIAKQQRIQHDSLLGLYQFQLTQANSRLESGVGVKNAVLTAKLNVLEEKERIVDLNQRESSLIDQLAKLTGIGKFISKPNPVDSQDSLTLPEDSAVFIAMTNDTKIADAQAEALAAKKRLSEKGWNFAPAVSLIAGVSKNNSSAQIKLGSNLPETKKQWAIDISGTQTLLPQDSLAPTILINGQPLFNILDPSFRYSAHIAVEFPLFRGLSGFGEVKQAMARYDAARIEILKRSEAKERSVREAFNNYHASLEKLSIAHERVQISRERYAFAEMQRDLGRMNEDGFDTFREQLFATSDIFFERQIATLEATEKLRKEIRLLK